MKNTFSKYQFFKYNPCCFSIEWQIEGFKPEFVKFLQSLIKEIKANEKDIKYITQAFDSILIQYQFEVNLDEKITNIKYIIDTFSDENSDSFKPKIFEIPVCYNSFDEDLEHISEHSGKSISEIIELHTSQTYTLAFIGFLPGFLYLGEVDKNIKMPRKQTPRARVEQGSVGIAENQTGIYPIASPGGWQIIGRTPLNIFDASKNPPSQFSPGDQIKFKAIGEDEFIEIYKRQKPQNQHGRTVK